MFEIFFFDSHLPSMREGQAWAPRNTCVVHSAVWSFLRINTKNYLKANRKLRICISQIAHNVFRTLLALMFLIFPGNCVYPLTFMSYINSNQLPRSMQIVCFESCRWINLLVRFDKSVDKKINFVLRRAVSLSQHDINIFNMLQ